MRASCAGYATIAVQRGTLQLSAPWVRIPGHKTIPCRWPPFRPPATAGGESRPGRALRFHSAAHLLGPLLFLFLPHRPQARLLQLAALHIFTPAELALLRLALGGHQCREVHCRAARDNQRPPVAAVCDAGSGGRRPAPLLPSIISPGRPPSPDSGNADLVRRSVVRAAGPTRAEYGRNTGNPASSNR